MELFLVINLTGIGFASLAMTLFYHRLTFGELSKTKLKCGLFAFNGGLLILFPCFIVIAL